MTRTYFRLNQGSALLEAKKPAAEDDGAGRYRIRIIAPGRGSTGMYTAPNLAESAPLFVPGTHMFFDHQTMTEDWERPERSVRDLAGVFESGAEIMPDGSLEADIKVYPSVNGIIRERWADIGVSINGWSVEEIGPDGVVPPLAGIQSVDFVTRAGAKGAVLEVLESDGRWRVKNPSNSTTNPNSQEEQAVKPEEIVKAVSEAVAAAMPAAIKEAAALLAADQEKKAKAVEAEKKAAAPKTDPYEAAAKIAEANDLPKEARARVMEAVKRGAGVDDAIEAERAYIKAIAPAPVVREDASAKTGGDVQVTSWAK